MVVSPSQAAPALLMSAANVPARISAPEQTATQPVLIDGRQPRILLVDDEPLNIKVVRKYLAGAGYVDFASTTNSAEVLPLMIREEPDLVLLDIVMPRFTGLDVIAAIRADQQLTHIPVVMLTALEDRETRRQAPRKSIGDGGRRQGDGPGRHR